jgi:hypothetical protein
MAYQQIDALDKKILGMIFFENFLTMYLYKIKIMCNFAGS